MKRHFVFMLGNKKQLCCYDTISQRGQRYKKQPMINHTVKKKTETV